MRYRWLAVLPGLLLASSVLAPAPLGAEGGVSGSAVLGTATTGTLVLAGDGLARTVQLYEAWPDAAPALAAEQPPAPLRVALPDQPGPISPALQQALAATPGGHTDMIVYLDDQADLSAAALIPDWNQRGTYVVATLRAHADRTQQPLLAELAARGYQPRSFWIVNAVAVRGDATLAGWLAAQPAVALVDQDARLTLEPAMPTGMPPASMDVPAWGVSQIGAPAVWNDWGVRGAGIVVGNIDTGVAYTHPALLQRYRGWSPAGLSHDYNWYDATGQQKREPLDVSGHGTHTMGTMVGERSGTSGEIGVAPGARWIAARACVKLICSNSALIGAAEWMLAPTNQQGANPRPDLRPHIINNSWGAPGDDDWYAGYVTAWNAAGIFAVFANGNSGASGCRSSNNPALYAEAFAVGATDRDDAIASFSSRGPAAGGRIKPDISAPGVAVPSAWPDGTIQLLSGTSMAAPHVAGAVALLWAANPILIGDIDATRAALRAAALPRTSGECGDLPDAIPNSVYGAGRLDVRQAVETVRVDVPWMSIPERVALPAGGSVQVPVTLDARLVDGPGTYSARILVQDTGTLSAVPVIFTVIPGEGTLTLSGRLIDRWTGQGVYGRVTAASGLVIRTDMAGAYHATLPPGDYALSASASGYVATDTTLSLASNATHDFVLLPDAPRIRVDPPELAAELAFGERRRFDVPIHNDGVRPLQVTAGALPQEWRVERDTTLAAQGGLYDLSGFDVLPLADDQVYTDALQLGFSVPIGGRLVNAIYVSSNGWASTVPPSNALPAAVCLPGGALPGSSLAPFWADLDPSAAGAVRAGPIDADTFVVSWEQLPEWREKPEPGAATYSFQLALHADGRIEYLYGAMGAPPARWSIGASQSRERGQSLGCARAGHTLEGNRVLTLRNQPLPAIWLRAEPAEITVAPGTSTTLSVTLHGLGAQPWFEGPFEGALALRSDDPLQREILLSARLQAGAPVVRRVLVPILR